MPDKKVLVSGCFDLIHSGHVTFLKTASQFGKLYVAVGADANLKLLKGKAPYFSEEERLYVIRSIRFVEEAFIAGGSGILDFQPDIERIKPDILIVNDDGHTIEKEELCKKYGVEYKVFERIPEEGLPIRASSSIKKELQFPYRICLAGGWLDQPWVSEIYPGSVVVAQLFPTVEFNDRAGMATSSRKIAIDIWGNQYPDGDSLKNARILFGAENPPGSKYISGSQDQIGLLNPGISRLYYNGGYWPERIDYRRDKDICLWLSNVLYLIELEPRPVGYDPLKEKTLSRQIVKELADAGEECWESILHKDIKGLGKSLTKTFLTWGKMLPYTVPISVMTEMKEKYLPNYFGATTSGSGGGYAVVVSDNEIEGAIKVKVRF